MLTNRPQTSEIRIELPTARTLYYDLFPKATLRGARPRDFGDSIFRKLVNGQRYCLEGAELPCIALGVEASLRMAYASCRKLAGRGTDAMRATDAELSRTWRAPMTRPNALLLTGDQIYADEIPADMFEFIVQLAARLGGAWAKESEPGFRDRYGKPDTRGPLVRLHSRRNATGFTVDPESGANQLIDEYEFLAAHILAWNARLWEGRGGLLERLSKKRLAGDGRS